MALIALDYDGTYTADPALWDSFIQSAKERGHRVVIATMRHPSEPIQVKGVDEVIYTSRKAKAAFLQDVGLTPNIWIDDMPMWIYQGA